MEKSSGPIFLLAGMWTVCANRLGEDQGTPTHLASQSSFSVYSPDPWRSGHGRSLLGQLKSLSYFTGTKVEFRLQLAFLPHSPSSFAAVTGTGSNKDENRNHLFTTRAQAGEVGWSNATAPLCLTGSMGAHKGMTESG